MDFSVGVNFITGMMLGLEFSRDEDESSPSKYLVIDLLIVRFVFGLHPIE